MTDKDKSEQANEAKAGAEEIKDEALEDAEGGFSLSGSFTKTLNTTTTDPSFTNINLNADENIITTDTTKDEAFLRVRPGRIGNPFGG